MKKLLTLSLLAVATVFTTPFAFANNKVNEGIYLGGQLGYVDLHNSRARNVFADMFVPIVSHAAGRAYVGYRLNQNWALESGYNLLAKITTETNSALISNSHIWGIDLSAKGIMPLGYDFEAYGKAGAMYTHQDIDTTLYSETAYRSNVSNILPLIGAGLGYNITHSFNVDLSWTHMFKAGSIHSIDFIALGLAYTF